MLAAKGLRHAMMMYRTATRCHLGLLQYCTRLDERERGAHWFSRIHASDVRWRAVNFVCFARGGRFVRRDATPSSGIRKLGGRLYVLSG